MITVSLHGYRSTGNRLLIYDVDDHRFPKISPPPVRYKVSCSAERARSFETDAREAKAASYEELISGWHRVNGARPRGAPVGMTVAADGAIWVVEDKNQTVIRIDRASGNPPDPLPCDMRTQAQIDELARFVASDPQKSGYLSAVRTGIVEKHCVGYHSDLASSRGCRTQKGPDRAPLHAPLHALAGWLDLSGDPDSGKPACAASAQRN